MTSLRYICFVFFQVDGHVNKSIQRLFFFFFKHHEIQSSQKDHKKQWCMDYSTGGFNRIMR